MNEDTLLDTKSATTDLPSNESTNTDLPSTESTNTDLPSTDDDLLSDDKGDLGVLSIKDVELNTKVTLSNNGAMVYFSPAVHLTEIRAALLTSNRPVTSIGSATLQVSIEELTNDTRDAAVSATIALAQTTANGIADDVDLSIVITDITADTTDYSVATKVNYATGTMEVSVVSTVWTAATQSEMNSVKDQLLGDIVAAGFTGDIIGTNTVFSLEIVMFGEYDVEEAYDQVLSVIGLL